MANGLLTTPNTFQRLMLQWERLAPYNAGQYATLALVDVDPDHVRRAWRDATIGLGLQQIGQHPDAALSVITDGPIESFVSAELNHRFDDGDSPLRPFLHMTGRSIHVGVIYRHVVADSASIRLVMRTWIERLLLLASTSTAGHISLLKRDPLRLIDKRRPWSVVRETATEFSRLSRMRRVRRLPQSATPTAPVAWRRIELREGLSDGLLKYARSHGVKVNDLFVAAAAMACEPWMPHEEADSRPDLAIGTIADVRPTDRPARDHFGLSLGFLQTVWRWQDLRSWPHALMVAATASRIARERHLASASAMRLWLAARYGDRLNDLDLATFYRKRCPIAAGISNVNLTRHWQAALHPTRVRAYTRISPLGPMLPLVLTPTTLGRTLHLGVTWRTGVIDEATCGAILQDFVECLERVAT